MSDWVSRFVYPDEEAPAEPASEPEVASRFAFPDAPVVQREASGGARTARSQGDSGLGEAFMRGVEKQGHETALDQLAPGAAVAGGLAALPLLPGAVAALPGVLASAGAAAVGAMRNPADLVRQRPLLAPIIGAGVEGVTLQEKANPATGGPIGEALMGAGVVGKKALTEAERRIAQNLEVRAGALKDTLAGVQSLAGEAQPGMAEFVARNTGDIVSEQAARGLAPEVMSVGARARNKAAESVGKEVGKEANGEGPIAELSGASRSSQRGSAFVPGAGDIEDAANRAYIATQQRIAQWGKPAATESGAGPISRLAAPTEARSVAETFANTFESAERKRVEALVEAGKYDPDGYIEEAVDSLRAEDPNWSMSDLRSMIEENLAQDSNGSPTPKKLKRILSYLDAHAAPAVDPEEVARRVAYRADEPNRQRAMLRDYAQTAAADNPAIGAEREAAIAARAAEVAPTSLPPAAAPVKSALDYATDADSAAARARVIDTGSNDPQRGAAFIPGASDLMAAGDRVIDRARPVGGVLDSLADKAGLRYNHGLSQFPSLSDPNVALDTVLAKTRSAQQGAPHTAFATARSLQADFKPFEKAAMDKYLVAKDEAARLAAGIPVSSRAVLDAQGAPVIDLAGKPVMRPTTAADLQQDLHDATQAFLYNGGQTAVNTPQRLKYEEDRYRAWTDATLARLKAAGKISPEFAGRPDWVHHIVEPWATDTERLAFGARKVPSNPTPGAAKQAEGSVAEILRDPYKSGAAADAASRQAELAKQFEQEAANWHNDLTEKVVSGQIPFDKEQHALYSFEPQFAGREAIAGYEAEQMVKHGEIGGYKILPKTLVEGLQKANAPGARLPGLVDALLTPGARLAKATNLALSPNFQFAQWPQDYFTHLANIKVREWPQFTREAGKNVKELWGAYTQELLKNGKSDLLEALRNEGVLTDTAMQLFDREGAKTPDWVGKVGGKTGQNVYEALFGAPSKAKIVSDQALPLHLREGPSVGEIPGFLWGEFSDAMSALGSIRETGFKKAMQTVLMSRTGSEAVSASAATKYANEISGNYWKSTDTGRAAGKIALMSKWFAEQDLRLTRKIAMDPALGGKASMSGLMNGPAPKIVALGLLTYALNHRNEKVARAAANLSSRDTTAIVLDVNEKGDPLVVSPDTLLKTAAAFGGSAKQFWDSPVEGVKEAMDTVASRAEVNPTIGALAALTSRRQPHREQGLTSNELGALNAKQGGLLGTYATPQTQQAFDAFTGAPGRIAKAFMERDSNTPVLGRLRAVGAALPGAPIYQRSATDRLAEERAVQGPRYWQQFIDNARPTPGTATMQTVQARLEAQQWLTRHGVSEGSLRAVLSKGVKNAHEAEALTRQDANDRLRARLKVGP